MAYTRLKEMRESGIPVAAEAYDGPNERRKSARYVPVINQGHLGWWEEDEFEIAEATILNVSLGGAALRIARRFPAERLAWMSIRSLEWAGWISADVVGVANEGAGSVVRLSFVAPLSYEVYKTAIWGFPEDEMAPHAETLEPSAVG